MRIFTSYDRDVIVFDTESSSVNRRQRYAYTIEGNVDRILNLSSLIGYTVTSIEAGGSEPNGQEKLVIRTTGGHRVGVIFFSYIIGDIIRITDDGAIRITDDLSIRILDISGTINDVELVDISLGKRPPYGRSATDTESQYIVQEDDVNYGITTEGDALP